MHGKVKLTRRQIKEDKFATFMLTAKDRFEQSWQYFVISAVAVILAVVAIVYYVNSSESASVEAGTKFTEALGNANAGNAQVAILNLTQIADEDADPAITRQAVFMLGRLNLEARNYPEAIRFFERYTSNYRDDKLMYAAAFAGLGACAENQGQFADAAAKYEQAAQTYPGGPSEGDYLTSSMRSYLLAGDTEKARSKLTTIKDKFKTADVAQRAERLFAEKGTTASGS